MSANPVAGPDAEAPGSPAAGKAHFLLKVHAVRGIGRALAIAALAAACDRALPSPCGGLPCATERTVSNTFQESVNRELDVLFVIDDTPAMAAHAGRLSSGIAMMAAELEWLAVDTSLHIGVVPASPCTAPAISFIQSGTCGQQTNITGTLAGEFTRLATLGFAGCSPAQPLQAVERTLTAPPSGWADFLRPEAYLAIVVIAADDDPSSSAARTIDLVLGLKPDPRGQILVSVAGPADCTGAATPTAELAPRLLEFLTSFGGNGLYYANCGDAYGVLLRPLVQGRNIHPPLMCIRGVRDTDPATPGLQPECAVFETRVYGDGRRTTTVLPACDAGPPPCWRLSAPSTGSFCGNQYSVISLEREPTFCPEVLSRVTMECVGCTDANDPACGG